MSHKKIALILGALLAVATACGLFDTANPSPTTQPVSPSENQPQTATAVVSPAIGQPPVSKAEINLQNAGQMKESGKIDFENPLGIVWSLDGRRLAVFNPQQANLLDAKSMESQAKVSFERPDVLYAVSPAGLTLVSSKDQATVELHDSQTGSLVLTVPSDAPFGNLAVSPDGKYLARTSEEEISTTLYDTASGQAVAILSGFQTAAPVYSVSFSADSKTLVWLSRGRVQLTDIHNQAMGAEFGHEDFVNALAISDNGKWLATCAAGTIDDDMAPLLNIWDAENGKSLQKIRLDESCSALQFSPGSAMLAGGSGSRIILWDTQTYQQAAILSGHSDRISALAFSPDGASLASASADGTLHLWTAAP